MPPLRNPRWEIAAQARFSGKTWQEAAICAGLSKTSGPRLAKIPAINNRVDNLFRQAASSKIMPVNERQELLSRMIRSETPTDRVVNEKGETEFYHHTEAIDLLNKMTPGAYVQVQPSQTFIDKAIILKVVYDDPKRINDSSA